MVVRPSRKIAATKRESGEPQLRLRWQFARSRAVTGVIYLIRRCTREGGNEVPIYGVDRNHPCQRPAAPLPTDVARSWVDARVRTGKFRDLCCGVGHTRLRRLA